MASDETIADFIMRPLMTAKQDADTSSEGIINNILQVSEIGTESDLNIVITAITDGKAALFVQGASEAIIPETAGLKNAAFQQRIMKKSCADRRRNSRRT